MPSQAELEEYQQDVEELSALAVAEVAAIVLALSGEDDPDRAMVEAVPTAIEQYMAASAQVAIAWYRGLARQEPRAPRRERGAPEPIVGPTDRVALLDAQEFEPRPAALPPREQLESTVWWALYEPPPPEPPADTSAMDVEEMSEDDLRREVQRLRPEPEPESEPDEEVEPLRARVITADDEESPRARVIPAEADEQQARIISRLAGATQRYVTNAARETVTENAEREGVRWARHAQPDACAFCRLLATRGPDYLTKESAKFVGTSGRTRGERKIGELYHDDCGCEPVPVRAGDAYEPPTYVSRWTTQYNDAYDEGKGDFKSILSSMRQAERERGGSRH